jgi:hypothetical protein
VKGRRFTLLPAPEKGFQRLVEGGTYFKKPPVKVELQTQGFASGPMKGM